MPIALITFFRCSATLIVISLVPFYKENVSNKNLHRLSMLTWFRSIIKVDKPTDTVSLVCIRVKILSVRPIVADSAGTKLPMCAKNTIKPTYKECLL